MFTVRYALQELARYNGVAGTCVEDPTNLKRLNRVRHLIYESPEDFVGTTDWAVIELGHCCHSFFLPEQLETARATARCNSPIPLLSKNYEFIDIGLARRCCHGSGNFGNKRAPHYLHVNEARTRTPYFVDCIPEGARIQVTNDDKADNGVVLRFACRRKGRPLDFELELNGLKPVISKKSIDDILGVTKPLTAGNVMVWMVVGDSCPQLIAEYSGRNENPRFSKYTVHGHHHNRHTNEQNQIVVFGKKKCFPYRPQDMDALMDIESLQALIYGYQALNATEAEDDNAYVAKVKLMETMLERADHNLEILEPMETCNVHYQTALDSSYWP